MDIALQKSIIRKSALKKRQLLPKSQYTSLSQKICDRIKIFLITELQKSQALNIAIYLPFKNEVDITNLLALTEETGLSNKAIFYLPAIDEQSKNLQFMIWSKGDNLIKGKYGIAIPQKKQHDGEPDILLIPLLAFDRDGNRLGYGKGYYDRAIQNMRLSKKLICIGVGFCCQEYNNIPHEPHDEKMNYIVTENEWIKINVLI